MSRVFIVRHGNTFAPGEATRRIGARTDLPLVPSGLAQADALGRWFAERSIRFSGALAGALRRTQETASRILAASATPCPVVTRDWLTEIDHGPDEDQPEAAVVQRVGQRALAAWDRDATPPQGWIVDGALRLQQWRDFFASSPPGDTLIVTSNGAARFALLAIPGRDPAVPLRLDTGALAELHLGREGVRLTSWNLRP